MTREQSRILGKLARAFEACAHQEHKSFEEHGGGPNSALPLSAMGLAHYRAMQAFQWCLEAVEEEIEELKEGGAE